MATSWARLRSRCLTAVFLAALSVPAVLTLAEVRGPLTLPENRRLAPAPSWQLLKTLEFRQFARQVDAYYSDHFTLRSALIVGVDWAKLQLGISSSEHILIGRHGWKYYLESSALLTDARDKGQFDQRIPANYETVFDERSKWVEAQGSHFLFVVMPGKDHIYREYLPWRLEQLPESKEVNEIIQAVRAGGVDTLYLRDAELAAKAAGRLYYKNDSHWNPLGALYGAAAIIKHLKRVDDRLPDLDPLAYEVTWRRSQTRSDGLPFDAGIVLGFPFLSEQVPTVSAPQGWHTAKSSQLVNDGGRPQPYAIHIFEQNAPQLPTLLLLGDSFSPFMYQPLAEQFRRAVFVNPWEPYTGCEATFPIDIIRREHPTFVIVERLEAGLKTPTANPAEIRQAPALKPYC